MAFDGIELRASLPSPGSDRVAGRPFVTGSNRSLSRISHEVVLETPISGLEWKTVDPQDEADSTNAVPIDQRSNSGGHPIKAGKYAQIDVTKPEHARQASYLDARGGRHIVPRYIARLAESIKETADAGDGVLMIGEESSGIDLSKKPEDAPVNEVRAIHMKTIGVTDDPLSQVQTLIERGIVRVTTGMDGKPKRITVPAATDPAAAREWINALFGRGYDTAMELIATSQIGANIVTGARGEPRNAIPATKLTVIEGDGAISYITDPAEIDSWYGTQGYAGAIAEVEMEIFEVPRNQEVMILPIPGDIGEGYLSKLPKIIAALYEYMYFDNAHDHKISVEAVEFMDITGCDTIARHSGHSSEANFRSTHLNEGCNGAICLRLRHNLPAGSIPAGYDEDPGATDLMDKIMSLQEQGLIGDPEIADNPSRGVELLDLRRQITEDARQEGKAEGNATASMDEEIVFDLGNLEATDSAEIDRIRIHVEQAMAAAIAPSIEAYLQAAEQGLHHTFYGHLRIGSEDQDPRNGGVNAHDRITGPEGQKTVIKGIETTRSQAVRALHGLEFGPITLLWREGEKHNPGKLAALEKAAELDAGRIARRAATIERGGDTFGYRQSAGYRQIMRQARERIAAMA